MEEENTPDTGHKLKKEKTKTGEEDDDEIEIGSTLSLISSLVITVVFVLSFFLEYPNNCVFKLHNVIVSNLLQNVDNQTLDAINTQRIKTFDDLNEYMNKILIPSSFGTTKNILNQTIEDLSVNTRNHFVNEYNYNCGTRITIRRVNLVANEDEVSKTVLPQIREEDYLSLDGHFENEYKEKVGDFEYSVKDSYNKAGGYVIYFNGTMTKTEALNLWKKVWESGLLHPKKGLSCVCEQIYFNANYRVGLYLNMGVLMTNTGTLAFLDASRGFFPQNYASFRSRIDLSVSLFFEIVFQIIAFFEALVWIFTGVHMIFDFFTGNRLAFSPMFLYNLIVIVLCFVSIGIFYELNFRLEEDFKIPLTKSQFQDWVAYSKDFETYYTINAILVILLCGKLIIMITKKFPSFGVVFVTLGKSKFTLLNFFFLLLVIAILFTLAGFFLFGSFNADLSSFQLALFNSFKNIIGISTFKDISAMSRVSSSLFLIVYCIIMFFIMLNLLSAIVLEVFEKIRSTQQLATEANARIIEEDGQIWTQKFLNLILCAKPGVQETSLEQKKRETEAPDAAPDIDDVIVESGKTSKEDEEKLSLWETFKLNLGLLIRSEPTTIEQVRKRREDQIHKLEKELEEKKKENQERQERNIIYSLWDFAMFLIFLIIYTVLIFTQLHILEYHQSSKSMDELLINANSSAKIEKITSLSQMSTLFGTLWKALFTDRKNDTLSTQALVFSNPLIRITLQRAKLFKNEDPNTADIIPYRRRDNNDNTESLSDIYPFYANISQPESITTVYEYYPEGSTKTYKKGGGVVMFVLKNETQGQIVFNHLFRGLKYDLKQLAIEIMTYARNAGMFVWSVIKTDYLDSGELEVSFNNRAMQISQYPDKLIFRSIPEIILALLVLYYNTVIFYKFLIVWEIKREEDNKACMKPTPEHTRLQRFLIFCFVNPKRSETGSSAEIVFFVFCGMIKLVFVWLRRILVSIFAYFLNGISSIIEMAWIVFINLQVFYWVRLILIQATLTYRTTGASAKDNFGYLSSVAQFQLDYIAISSFAAFFSYICLIRFFSFFSIMSMLMEVLSRTYVDLLFFTSIFMIMIFGFTISGMMAFGSNTFAYYDFSSAFLSTFKIVVGGMNYEEVNANNPSVAPCYFILVYLIFVFIFVRMFMSLVAIIYQETMKKLEQEQGREPPKGITLMITQELVRMKMKLYNNVNPDLTEEERMALAVKQLPIPYRIANCFFSTPSSLTPEKEKIVVKPIENFQNIYNNNNAPSNEDQKINPFIAEYLEYKKEVKQNENALQLDEIEKSEPSLWLTKLDSTLSEYSINKVNLESIAGYGDQSFFEIMFYPKRTTIDLSSEVKKFVYSQESKFEKQLWNQIPIEVKYQYWEGMDTIFAEDFESIAKNKDTLQTPSEEEKAYSESNSNNCDLSSSEDFYISKRELVLPLSKVSFPEFVRRPEYCSSYSSSVSAIQFRCWTELPLNEKIILWVIYFSGKQRAKLWGSLFFPPDKISQFFEIRSIHLESPSLQTAFEYAQNKYEDNQIEKHRFLCSLISYLCFEIYNTKEILELQERIHSDINKLVTSKQDINFFKVSPTLIPETSESPFVNQSETFTSKIKDVLHLAERLHILYLEEGEINERAFLWNFLTLGNKIELFLNYMNGDVIDNTNKILDCEAETLAIIMSLDNPISRREKDTECYLENLFEKAANAKSYLRIKASAELVSKQYKKYISEERIKHIEKEITEEETKLKKYYNINE